MFLLMTSMKSWVEALQIPEASFELWRRESPKNTNFTFWCLQSGKISPDKYLNWAQEHFQLARINSEFFKSKPNVQLWKKIKTVANWSPEMIPISEWDGTIFIACIEPNWDIKWSFPVQYLLANPHDLKNYWQALVDIPESGLKPIAEPANIIQQLVTKVEEKKVSQVVAVKPMAQKTAEPKQSATTLSVPPVPTALAEPKSSLTPPPLKTSDGPAGLNITSITQVSSAQVALDPMEELTRKMSQATKTETQAPENLNWSPKQTEVTNDGAPEGILLPKDNEPLTSSLKFDFNTVVLQPISIPSEDVSNATPSPLIAQNQNIEEADSALSPLDNTSEEISSDAETTNEVPEITSSHNIATLATPALPKTTVKLEKPPQELSDFIKLVKSEFKGGMLVEIKNDQFVPIIWDENFNPVNPKALSRWSLSSASAFRVAYRTKMPYLGHVVTTPINEEFFKVWGYEQRPDVLLIQPVTMGSTVRYLIVALPDKGKKNHLVLASGEKIMREVQTRLKNQAA